MLFFDIKFFYPELAYPMIGDIDSLMTDNHCIIDGISPCHTSPNKTAVNGNTGRRVYTCEVSGGEAHHQ